MFRLKLLRRVLPVALSVCVVATSVPTTSYAAEYRLEETAETKETNAEKTPEATVMPSAEPEETTAPEETQTPSAEETAVPEETPEAAGEPETTITPEVTPEPEETATPSAVPEETPEANETASPTAAPIAEPLISELDGTEEVPELSEGENYSLYITTAGEQKWLQFTAAEAGEYIFYTGTDSRYNSALYKQMTDEEPVKQGESISYSYGSYCIYEMKAGETVYWKLGYYYSYNTGSISATVKKKAAFSREIKDVTVTQIPYGFEIELTWYVGDSGDLWYWRDNTYGIGGSPLSLAYSSDKEADFGVLEDMIKISGYEKGSIPDNIKTVSFEEIDYSYSDRSIHLKATTSEDMTMLPSTSYNYAIMVNVENGSQGYNGIYYWDIAQTGQAMTGDMIEKTRVSIKEDGFTAEAGYAYALGSATVSNPGNEPILEKGFYVAKDDSEAVKMSVGYWEEDDAEAGVFEGRYLFGTAKSCTLTPYVTVRSGAEGEKEEVKGTPLTVNKKDPSAIQNVFQAEPASGKVAVTGELAVGNKADSYLCVSYNITDSKGASVVSSYTCVSCYEGMWEFSQVLPDSSSVILTPGEQYEIELVIGSTYPSDSDYEVIYSEKLSFSPKAIVTYTEKEIPDETLRAILLQQTSSSTLTSDKLEAITSLYVYGVSGLQSVGATKAIKDLQGIEYLTNLEHLTINGQDIEDISDLTKLTKLESISLRYNDVNKIPDFSKNSNLRYLDLSYNLISSEEFTADKFTDKMKQNQSNLLTQEQRSEAKINFSDVYYNNADGETVLAFEIEGIKNERDFTLNITVGETQYEVPCTDSWYGQYTITTQIQEGNYPLTIEAQESYGGRKLSVSDKNITVKKPEAASSYQKYLSDNDSYVSVEVLIPYSTASEKITDLKLVDKAGTTVATKSYASLSESQNARDIMPGVFKHGYFSVASKCFWEVYGTVEVGSKKLSGSYDLIVTTSENKTYTFEAYAVTDYPNPLVTYVSYNSEYDNAGEYFHMTVEGEALNADAFYPVLLSSEGKAVTEYVSYIGESSGRIVYKLKKLSGFPEDSEVAVNIVTRDKYSEVKVVDGLTVYTYTQDRVLDIVYNAKVREYVLYASSALERGTELSLILCSQQPSYNYDNKKFSNYGTKYGTASVVITGDKNIVEFKDEDGNFCERFRNKPYYFGAVWQKDNSLSYETGWLAYRESGFGVYESTSGSGNGAAWVSYTGETYQQASNQISAEFTAYNNTTYQKGDVLKLSLSKYNVQTRNYVAVAGVEADLTAVINAGDKTATFAGKLTSETEFEVGQYRLTVQNQSGETCGSGMVYIVKDAVYQLSQGYGTMYPSQGREPQVIINTAVYLEKGFDKSKLSYEFYDLNGNKITGWKRENIVDDYSGDIEGYHYVRAYFSNLYDRYHYMYCKVLYNGKLMTSIDNPSVSYYKVNEDSDCSEAYGEKIYLRSGVSFTYSTGKGMCGVISSLVSDYTITIYTDEHAEPVTEFTVPTRGSYGFTKDNLKDVIEQDPELKGLYTLVAMKKGVILEAARYVNVGYTENLKAPTGIILDKTNATLSKGETLTLKATITPADADTSRTWKSSDENVATVAGGVVTAVGAGKATITATTVNSKTASCQITVVDYKISDTEITLNVGDKDDLAVLNGTEKVKAQWSTSDGSVAMVDAATGKVTAIGKGTAVITAKIADGPSFNCKVTVTNELKEITLQGTRNVLEIGDKDTLKIIFNPASEEADSKVEWSSSNDKVVTVDEKGVVTAVGEGEATIKASAVSGGSENVCENTWTYTVCASDKADPIPEDFTLHAVTNVDKTLADIPGGLPDKWNFVDGTVSLASFKGLQEKEFAVIHTNKNTGEVQYDTVTVKISTIEQIKLLDEEGKDVPSNLATGDKEIALQAVYTVGGEPLSDRLEDLELNWKLTGGNGIVETQINEDGSGSMKALKAGKAMLQLKLFSGEKEILSKQQNIAVADSSKKGIADVKVALVDGEGTELSPSEDGTYALQKGEPVYLKDKTELKADGTSYKISYKSSDAGVVKIGKADKSDKSKTELVAGSCGTAVIQATADDTLKSSAEIRIKVEDRTPAGVKLSQTSVTINTAMKDEYEKAEIRVYNGYDAKLEGASLSGIEGATVAYTEDGNVTIRAKKSGTGTLSVKLEDMEKEVSFKLTVKVTDKKPGVTIKQTVKMNALYKNVDAVFAVGASGQNISDVSVNGLVRDEDYEYLGETGTLIIKNGSSSKYTVSVDLEQYDPQEKTISIAQEKENFKLSATSATIYTDSAQKTAVFRLIDKRTGLPVDLSDVNVTPAVTAGSGEYVAMTEQDKLLLTALADPDKKGDKVSLQFESDAWRSPVILTATIKPALLSKASLQLGQKSLTLYNYKGMSASTSTTLTLTGNSEASDLLAKLAIMEVPNKKLPLAKDKTLKITYENGVLKVAKNGENLAEGTYKFNLELAGETWSKPLKATLSVKVVNVDMADEKKCAAVTVSKSGTIDVLDRAGTSITLKPKFKNVAREAEVTEIRLTGRDAHLFEITGRSGNNVTVSLKEDANVITKYGYRVAAEYLIKSGDTELTLTGNPVEIKLTQKKPKAAASGEGVYSNTLKEDKKLDFAVYNSAGVKLDVEKVELLNLTKDFAYDAQTGNLTHYLNGETAKGKTYTLKFNVYPEGCGDNEKPIVVSYKVKIVK